MRQRNEVWKENHVGDAEKKVACRENYPNCRWCGIPGNEGHVRGIGFMAGKCSREVYWHL